MRKLFFHRGNKIYFLSVSEDELPLKCDSCKDVIPLADTIILQKNFIRGKYLKKYICQNCVKPIKLHTYNESIVAYITSTIPPNCVLVEDTNPSLKAANISVFDAAVSNQGISADTMDTVIVNKTKLAGKETIQGAQIGADISKLDRKLDKPKDVDKLLGDTAAAEVLPPKEKKEIEHQKNDSGRCIQNNTTKS